MRELGCNASAGVRAALIGATMAALAACAPGVAMREAGGDAGGTGDVGIPGGEGREIVDRVWLGVVPAPGAMPAAPANPPAQPTAEMQAVLDQLASFGAPPISESTPANAREAPTPTDAVMALLASRNVPVPTPAVRQTHVTMPGPHGTLLARVFTPTQGTGPFPVVVYYHGGGWVIADVGTYAPGAAAIAEAANAVVVSVAYHQAPVHRFPAAHDDAFAAYQWVLENAAQVGGDPARVAVAGESAGGNLATAVALMARDRGVRLPVHQLLVYPITSFNLDSPSYIAYANAKPLSKPAMHWFFDKYMRSEADARSPYLIPIDANLAGLPPATVINAQIDPLQWDGEEYARRLRAAGVPVEQRTFDGVAHEFFGMAAVLPQAREAVSMAGTRLKEAFGSR